MLCANRADEAGGNPIYIELDQEQTGCFAVAPWSTKKEIETRLYDATRNGLYIFPLRATKWSC